MVTCPTCARENPDDARFCSACGAELERAPAPREERKVVTVLFADLVGFTSQAERLDPEDVRAVLSGYHERVRFELQRYGGTVEKFIGDAVMALFGAPTAREDDPERAVRAALALRDAIADLNEQQADRDLHVRVGITTGEALVRLDVRPQEGEGMAAGDVVNTAARLQTAAPTDGILVDETTYRATERAIEYREVAPVDAKGKAAPIEAHEALHARSRYGVDVRQIGRTPLVGRESELGALTQALARIRAEREPQLVTLVGVPGIGKSRLVYELFRSIEGSAELVTWRQGRSLPYSEEVSYWALGEMVKAQAGILETDSEQEVVSKLNRAIADLVVEERDAAWVERNLRPLIGLTAETELSGDRRGEAFSAWRRFFEALADVRPLVLVFEDLHFADDGLLDFVDYLVDWARGVPLLVVGTARPELLSRRPGWGGGKANALTLSLQALSDSETAQLVHALLDRPVLNTEVQQQLVERAEGNPLYAEEFARLVAEGRQPQELPETVQGIVGARIDALTLDEKQRLQDAAVVGKVFWLGAVAAITGAEPWSVDELLHSLERKEFVRRERRSSVEGETEYAFRHLVVRDVAYGQIPRGSRAAKHRAMAEWLEDVGRSEDHAEMLAHHYLAALELARASGVELSVSESAHRALREAGDRAFGLFAFLAASRFYGEAIAFEGEPDPELLFRHAEALYRSGSPDGESILEKARDALVAGGQTEQAAEVEALLAEAWWFRGDRDQCFAHLARAEGHLQGNEATRAKARVLSQVARVNAIGGDAGAALSAGQRALEIAEELGLDEIRAHALDNISLAKYELGDSAGAIEDVQRSIEIALAVNSPESARGLNNLSVYWFVAGDNPEALRLREESVCVGERHGNDERQTQFTRASVVLHLYLAGRWDEAVRLGEEVLGASEGETSYAENFVIRARAIMRHARGEDDAALLDITRAMEIARIAGDSQIILPTLGIWLRIAVEQGLDKEAERAAAELLPLLSEYASTPQVWLSPEAFWAAGQSGRLDDFRRVLGQPQPKYPWSTASWDILEENYLDAADRLAGIGDSPDEAFARLRAAEQLVAAGRRAEADEQLHKALGFFRSVGAARYVRRGEALLAAIA